MAKKGNPASQRKFVFRRHASIGAADAIEDTKFLVESFVDRGELAILKDNERPECIVLGRTGTGKTALLEKLARTEERVIQIVPENLAISYISNNQVLRFFMVAGVNMDLFFRLLWRHVFAIELIKERFQIVNEDRRDSFLATLRNKIRNNKSKQEAIDYLLNWGESFWQETDYRVREITTRLEKDLGSTLEANAAGNLPILGEAGLSLSASYANKLSKDEKAEVVKHGQPVVDRVQIRVLSEIIKLLEGDILDDPQKKYYITIDRLDEDWANDDLRYQLIRALLETIRDFNNKLSNVKIVVAIREDLLDRVFRFIRSPGYQEEKYKSLYLILEWNEQDLELLLDKRVDQLVKEQYTNMVVRIRDLLPNKIERENSLKYIMRRTLLRPRDVITFFNECIRVGENRAKFSQQVILQAEDTYSTARLRAIGDEWAADYRNLLELALFLKGFPAQFRPSDKISEIQDRMVDFLINMEQSHVEKRDSIYHTVESHFNDGDVFGFVQEMFRILYRVGIVGIRMNEHGGQVKWSYLGHKLLGYEIGMDSRIEVHPAFFGALGIM